MTGVPTPPTTRPETRAIPAQHHRTDVPAPPPSTLAPLRTFYATGVTPRGFHPPGPPAEDRFRSLSTAHFPGADAPRSASEGYGPLFPAYARPDLDTLRRFSASDVHVFIFAS